MHDESLTRTLALDIKLFRLHHPFGYPMVGKTIGFAIVVSYPITRISLALSALPLSISVEWGKILG